MSLNNSPIMPSVVQLQSTIRPPGRQTRASSFATTSCLGANWTPQVESTRSKLASSKGRSSASPATHSTSTRAEAARSRAASNSWPARASDRGRSPWLRARRRPGPHCRCRWPRPARPGRPPHRPPRRRRRRRPRSASRSRRSPRRPGLVVALLQRANRVIVHACSLPFALARTLCPRDGFRQGGGGVLQGVHFAPCRSSSG